MSRNLLASALLVASPVCVHANAVCQPCGRLPPPCAALTTAANVFVGTVTDIRPPRYGALPSPDVRTIIFSVERSYKGAAGRTFEARSVMDSCEHLMLAVGEEYLVYAGAEQAVPNVVLNYCTRTRRAAEAAKDLRYLDALSGGMPELSVNGLVSRGRDEGLGGARVRVEGGGVAYEAVTDGDGAFEVAVKRPGTYAVTITLDGEHDVANSDQWPLKAREVIAGRTVLRYEMPVEGSRCGYLNVEVDRRVR